MPPKNPSGLQNTNTGSSASSDRAAYVASVLTPYGRVKKTVHYDARGLRKELDVALATAQKRRTEDHLERDKEKYRRLSNITSHEPIDDFSPLISDTAIPLEPADILSGHVPLNISHAGGELLAILHDEEGGDTMEPRKHTEWRTRRDRVENRTRGFARQMSEMVNAYLKWDAGLGDEDLSGAYPSQGGSGLRLHVVDIFSTRILQTNVIDGLEGIAASLIQQGLIPCAPFRPGLAITTRLLAIFRNLHLRCPHLSIQAFVKGLCDLHGRPFQPYLTAQFTICYDLFVEIRAMVREQVDIALGRDTPNWRLQNACSACTYKLKDEPPLVFDMLVTMDGNDSLKRFIRKDMPEYLGEGNPITMATSREVLDTRRVHGDYYIERDQVDRWARDPVMQALQDESRAPGNRPPGDNPCASRWSNMSKEATSQMWGIFDETGVFLSLCRHGYVLTIADMVQSGEQAKYPLATVKTLLDAFGAKIGGGYDIGCKFTTTLGRSELGERARELCYTPLVGSFHGHAHNRLCQLSHLATYVEGMGLEDLEGCKQFFSKSNALAASVRYSSVFHRKQRILEYIKHMDTFETSHNLSEFLVNNYKQALEIIEINGHRLEQAMKERGITSTETFRGWLAEEREYLLGLSKEPEIETLHIDYHQSLVKLSICNDRINMLQSSFIPYQLPSPLGPSQEHGPSAPARPKQQNRQGLQLLHAREEHAATQARIHDLETVLGLTERWVPGSKAWESAAALAAQRTFRKCVDELESLVVSRIFELTKMNMAQTGYKLRKHISNALQQRSHAIRNAIDRYNVLVKQMKLSRPTLTWDQVVSYAFLADFDTLRDCRDDINKRPWANPGSRTLMDDYFEVLRAKEEIVRLNVEIQRVVTYLHDEEHFLLSKEQEIRKVDPILAHQIKRLQSERLRFSSLHMQHFHKLSSFPAFSGCLNLGQSLDRSRHEGIGLADVNTTQQLAQNDDRDPEELQGEEEELELQGLDERLSIITAVLSAQVEGV